MLLRISRRNLLFFVVHINRIQTSAGFISQHTFRIAFLFQFQGLLYFSIHIVYCAEYQNSPNEIIRPIWACGLIHVREIETKITKCHTIIFYWVNQSFTEFASWLNEKPHAVTNCKCSLKSLPLLSPPGLQQQRLPSLHNNDSERVVCTWNSAPASASSATYKYKRGSAQH